MHAARCAHICCAVASIRQWRADTPAIPLGRILIDDILELENECLI